MTPGQLSGLEAAAERIRRELAARLDATAAAAWRDLVARGAAREGARAPELALPRGFAEVLAGIIAVEDREGTPRGEALRRHYVDFMPRLRVEQLATRAEPDHSLLHRPLRWERLPRLSGAIDRLFALLAEAGALQSLLGCESGPALRARYRTLGELYERTYYGGFMPLLYGYPADLAYFGRALDAGGDFEETVDRHLTAPILHELAHLDPSTPALFPLYLDECVAGYLGVRVLREFAYPTPGADHALYAAPWFAQVGQALVRACGLGPVVRAHAGAEPWTAALPPGLAATLARAGLDDYLAHRQPHLLSDSFRPERWIKLILLGAASGSSVVASGPTARALAAAAGQSLDRLGDGAQFPPSGVDAPLSARAPARDAVEAQSQDTIHARAPAALGDARRPGERAEAPLEVAAALPWSEIPVGTPAPLDAEILDDALAAMCLHNTQVERHFVVASRPPPAPIHVDVAACRVSTARADCDPAPPAYWFPPALATRLRARGIAGFTVEVTALEALPEVARSIRAAAEPDGPLGAQQGSGFVLRCHRSGSTTS